MSAAPHLHVVDESMATGDGLVDLVRRRIDGAYAIDPWGLDDDLVALGARVGALRWHIDLRGIEHLPTDGPALLICNRRLGWAEPAVLATAVARASDRNVRPVGCPDIDPLGGLLRRFGALPARPDDLASALRAGELVAVPTRRELVRFRAGYLPIHLLSPAVAQVVPVIPVAITGWEAGRRWNVRIGPAVPTPASPGPRSVGRVAVDVATDLNVMLEEAATGSTWRRVSRRLRSTGGDLATHIVPTTEIEV